MGGAPAYDQIIQGLSGAMSVTGDAETAPLRTGFPVSDTIAGITAAFAIAARSWSSAQRGTGGASTSRCSTRLSPRWAGWSPTT